MPGIGDKRATKLSAEGLTVNGARYQPTTANDKAATATKAKTTAATKP